jgi:hypothetical protein
MKTKRLERIIKKEGGNKMKTLGIILTAIILAAVCSVNAHAVPVTDKTVSISATGSITGTTALSIVPTSIVYGNTAADAYPNTPANNKVVITYASNYNPWKMMVYTNNTQVPLKADASGNGRYAKGGLATADGKSVVPCKWVAKIGTNAVVPTMPTAASLHNFVKDKRDEDDPATATNDESWTAAFTGGYPNIAYGGPGGGFCVDPTNSTPGPTQYQGDAVTAS